MKTAQQSADKFVANAGAASGYYEKGVKETTRDQAASAAAAAPAWASGVQKAITRGAFAKGVTASGKQKWLEGVTKKGVNRFGEGVAAARDAYATNSGKYDGARAAAANMPRGARGSAENYNRSAAVGKALNTQRTGTSA